MLKTHKLKKMVGAIISFEAETPESNVGEDFQHVILKITSYKKTKQGPVVLGIALKRLEDGMNMKFRQYRVSRILDRTIAIVADNEWTKRHPELMRIGDKRLRVFDKTQESQSSIRLKQALTRHKQHVSTS